MLEADIVDPTQVTRLALRNAPSVGNHPAFLHMTVYLKQAPANKAHAAPFGPIVCEARG